MIQSKEQYPQIYISLKKHLGSYQDKDFQQRRQMIRNIPYLKDVSDSIISDILYLMKPRRYETGMSICQRGDNVSHIMLVKSGYIAVEVPRL